MVMAQVNGWVARANCKINCSAPPIPKSKWINVTCSDDDEDNNDVDGLDVDAVFVVVVIVDSGLTLDAKDEEERCEY